MDPARCRGRSVGSGHRRPPLGRRPPEQRRPHRVHPGHPGQVHPPGRDARAGATSGRSSSVPAPTAGSAAPTGSPTTARSSAWSGSRTARPRWPTPQRPEQGAWAERMAALFDGPVEFHDSDDVTLLFDGGSDEAGFVQIIRGKVDDPARLRAVMTSDPEALHEMRPDILGATLAIEADGTYTETVAFTDEDERPQRRGRSRPRRRSPPSSSTPCRARRSTTCGTPGSSPPEPGADPPDSTGGSATSRVRQAGKASPLAARSRSHGVAGTGRRTPRRARRPARGTPRGRSGRRSSPGPGSPS